MSRFESMRARDRVYEPLELLSRNIIPSFSAETFLSFTMFNPTASSCHITYKAAKKTRIFTAFVFVSSKPQATVTPNQTDALAEAQLEPAASIVPTSEGEVGGGNVDGGELERRAAGSK